MSDQSYTGYVKECYRKNAIETCITGYQTIKYSLEPAEEKMFHKSVWLNLCKRKNY